MGIEPNECGIVNSPPADRRLVEVYRSGIHASTLSDFLDERVFPALFERLDVAMPEFGFVRNGTSWVAEKWPPNFNFGATEKRPDRLVVYKNRPWYLKVHGLTGMRIIDHFNDGVKPAGARWFELVRKLAILAGIESEFPAGILTEADLLALEARESRRRALEICIAVFQEFLWSDLGSDARSYLTAYRHFSEDEIRDLELGYYPSVQALKARLQEVGVDIAAAQDAGLLWSNFEGYVAIPWHDPYGHPLTVYWRFAGQPLPAGRKKTLALPGENTKGSPLYLNRALRERHRDLVAVEGVFDAALLQVRGETRAVAYVAAQFSRGQVGTLKQQRIRSVTLCPDPDGGGDEGAERSIRMLHEAGIDCYLAPRLPNGMDPDEFLIANEVNAWRKHVEGAVHSYRHIAANIVANYKQADAALSDAAAKNLLNDALKFDASIQVPEKRPDLDTFFWPAIQEATGLKKTDIRARRKQEVPPEQPRSTPPEGSSGLYANRNGCMCIQRTHEKKTYYEPLCNFSGKITEEIRQDDGVEQSIIFSLDITLSDGTRFERVRVPAGEFRAMEWLTRQCGAKPIIQVGANYREHVLVGLQTLSGRFPTRNTYAHLGWTKHDGKWIYLYNGGAIGQVGQVCGVEVAVPAALQFYRLPDPPQGQELIDAVRASLDLLRGLGPDRLIIPEFCAVYRAPLGATDFSLHFHGLTGTFKTEKTSAFVSHYGSEVNSRNLPCTWLSTGNSLEATAFAAKEVFLPVDDFAPSGSHQDVLRYHREAERLLRAQGNGAGRQRMKADGSLRPAKPPRSLIVSTGEDVPRGASVRARTLVIEVRQGDINASRLTEVQRDAAAGKYARAFSAYICWLASRIEQIKANLRRDVERLRADFLVAGTHARTSEILAQLSLGLWNFLSFAEDSGAISGAQKTEFWNRGCSALMQCGKAQGATMGDANPALQFIRLLRAALTSKLLHVQSMDGGVPDQPELWGWQPAEYGTPFAKGKLLAWTDGMKVFLEPEIAFAEAQRMASEQGETIAITQTTLHRRLRDQGLILETDEARQTLTVRKTIAGARRNVLILAASTLVEIPDQPAQTTPTIRMGNVLGESLFGQGPSGTRPAGHVNG